MDNGATRGALVHIVDDDAPVRRSLDFMLRNAGYHTEAWSNGDEFLQCADRSVPGCVLLDVRMPGRDGMAVLEVIMREGLNFPVIILTGHGEIDLAVAVMKAGAQDFIEKPFERDRLINALDDAFASLGDSEVKRLKAEWAQTELTKLTEREREVLHGLACGFPNKTIAYDLGISARTVEVYRANVMAKLEAASFAEALRIAFAAGLGSKRQWYQVHQPSQPAVRLGPAGLQ